MRLSRVRFTVEKTIATVLMIVATGRAAEDSPKARLAAIEAAQKEASARYGKELQAAGPSAEAQKPAVDRYLAAVEKNAAAALRLAREAPDDPAAADALKFVIKTNRAGPGPATAEALRMMLDRRRFADKGQGDYLAHVALTLFQYPDAEALLRRVLDRNPYRDDRAAGCYWLARHLSQKAHMIRLLREKPDYRKNFERHFAAEPIGKFVEENDPDALDQESEALLERATREFGDVRLTSESRPLSVITSGELYARRNLGVGKDAPEIEGFDHEGKPFRLSETRGKVVVLTFSGNWCGPCVGMYPQERALLVKLKDKPFALVSVNTDKDLSTLKSSIARGDITWRCWWDGGTDGPITTRWGIQGFPSIFVLDETGTIRFKDLRGDDLDKAVASLLNHVLPQR